MAANVDGVRPTSGVSPATGAGPAGTTKPDPSKENATPATGMGLHASRGGPMRSAQKTSGPSAAALPAKTKVAIEDALAEVEVTKVRLRVAVDRYNAHPDDEDLRSAELANLKGARANLGQVIAREADRLSPRSSLVPKEQRHTAAAASKNPPPSVTKLREFEAKVVNGTPLVDRDEVAGAILKSKELRIVGELALASAAMQAVAKTKDPHLSASQTAERESIVADMKDCVTQARPVEEIGYSPEERAEAQLARFKSIADRVTTPAGQFDPYLFFWLKDGVRASMVAANMDAAYLDKFDHLVASYSNNLAPQ
jgi:hypothetical protein